MEQIVQHATRSPYSMAVRYQNKSLNYKCLNEQSNQLAHYLNSIGITKDSLVAVCFEPNVEIVITLIAILKCGAVYIPIDPTYPQARIDTIINDINPSLIITNLKNYEHFVLKSKSQSVFIYENNVTMLASCSKENFYLATDDNQIAYVIYTSGTTGKPKGVMATYGNLKHYIEVSHRKYGYNSQDVIPAIARFSFSISLFELLSPLYAGGVLLIIDREHILNMSQITATLSEVTCFHIGPSLLKSILKYIKDKNINLALFKNIRHASSGGDLIPSEILEQLKLVFANAEIYTIYGCSEISCMGCTYKVPRESTVQKTLVGKAFDDMSVLIIDENKNKVSSGTIGEIYFSGKGLVKGYMNRPELDQDKFILIGNARYYSTGDLGIFNADDDLQILGRSDFQIKINGMRIETSEVEFWLKKNPYVQDLVVGGQELPDGGKKLIAFVVLTQSTHHFTREEYLSLIETIRNLAVFNLPQYMVPSSIVELIHLPLNHNLKIDYQALLSGNYKTLLNEREAIIKLPKTNTEKKFIEFCKEILNTEYISLDQNFFDLGGQSISALEFIQRVEDEFNVRLDGMEILRESLETLTHLCDERRGGFTQEITIKLPVSPDRIETFFFGKGQDLYGVCYYPQKIKKNKAILICHPLGVDHVRTQFIINKLSKNLSKLGHSVFRFDYLGTGNSKGDAQQSDCQIWTSNIEEAYQEIFSRTNSDDISVVGIRLGATLISGTNTSLFSKLIYWDPIEDGSTYLSNLERLTKRYFHSSVKFNFWMKKNNEYDDLLGIALSKNTQVQLKSTSLIKNKKTSIVESHSFQQYECGWDELNKIKNAIPDFGIVKKIISLIEEEKLG